MGAAVAERLMVEMDGRTVLLEAKIAEMEQRLATFSQKAASAGEKAAAAAKPAADAAGAIGQRYANAAVQIASATENAARAGKVTGEAAKSMIAQGSQMAFMFGPEGAVVGAIGIAAVAVVELFQRSRDEMKKTVNEFRTQLEQLASSGDLVGAARKQQELFSGNRFAIRKEDESDVSFRSRRGGVEGLERRRREIEAALAEVDQKSLDRRTTPLERSALTLQFNKLSAEQRELTKELEKQKRLYEETKPVIAELIALETRRASNAAAQVGREEAEKKSKESAEEAARKAKALQDAIGKAIQHGAFEAAAAVRKLSDELDKAASGPSLGEKLAKDAEAALDPLAKLDAQLRQIELAAAEGVNAGDRMRLLSGAEETIRRQLRLLGDSTKEQERRVELEKRLKKVLDDQQKVYGEIRNAVKEPARDLTELARNLQDGVRAALQLAEAFGVIDQQASQVLQSVGQIAGGVLDIASGHVFRGGLSVAGGIASIASSLFGDSPEEVARRKVLEDNTRAIEELTGKVGLLGLGISGSQAGTAQTALARLFSPATLARMIGAQGGYKAFTDANLKSAGLSAQDIAAIHAAAQALGITLDDTAGGFRQLQDALADSITKLGEFDRTYSDQRRQLDADLAINGHGSDPRALLEGLRAIAGQEGSASAGIAGLFTGLDLGNTQDLDTLRKRVQELFAILRSGDAALSAEQLGDLSGDEFLQTLLDIIRGLDQLGGAMQRLSKALDDADVASQILDESTEEAFRRRAQAYQQMGGALGELFAGLDVTKADDVATLDARIRELFERLQTSPESIDLAGLSLEDLIRILLDLDSAADAVAAGVLSAADAFNEAAGRLQTEFAILGTGSVDQAKQLAGAAGESFSGIADAIAGIDLSNADGRKKAEQALQDLYRANPTDKELAGAILSVLQAIRAVPAEAGEASPDPASSARATRGAGERSAVASGARNLSEATGNRMADYLSTIAIRVGHIAEALDAFLARAAGAVITPPAIGFGAASVAGAGGVMNVFRVQVGPINLTADDTLSASAAERLGAAIGYAAGTEVNRILADALLVSQRRAGDVSLPGR